jgi:hypothetical protein
VAAFALLGHVVVAALTAVSWLGLGSALLTPLPSVGDRALDLLNRIGAGAIGFALLTMAAGWLGVLDRAAYAVAFAMAVVAGVVVAARWARHLPRPPALRELRPFELLLVALLFVYLVLGVVAVAAPVSSPDALLYHAADPVLFEESGRILEVPWNSSSYEPFTVEMLVLDGVILWDAVQGAFAPFLLALLAVAVAMAAAWRLAGRPAALLAGAILFAQPFMLWESTSVFVEPGVAALVALAGWNVARFTRTSQTGALVLAGVFVGGAAGTKYLGLVAACAIGAALLVACGRRLRGVHLLAITLPAVAVAAPWYVKNALLTGNPFYPHVFGGLNAWAAAELERSMRSFGHGQDATDLVLLPARLLADGEAFDGGEWISPLFLAFAPLAMLAPAVRRYAGPVSAAVVVYGLGWFLTTQQARFLVPLMPLGAVLAAVGVVTLAGRGAAGRVVAVGAAALALAAGLAASAAYGAQFTRVVLGAESKSEFLTRKVSLYEGVTWLNENLTPGDKVAVDFWSLLYLDVPYVTFGTMGDLLPPDEGPAATRAFLDEYGVSHVAVLEGDTARRRQVEVVGGTLLARVSVRSVRSRTRNELGPRRTLLVYRLPSG